MAHSVRMPKRIANSMDCTVQCAMCIEGNLFNPNWNETAKTQKENALHSK